jgi:hypothetical protein
MSSAAGVPTVTGPLTFCATILNAFDDLDVDAPRARNVMSSPGPAPVLSRA